MSLYQIARDAARAVHEDAARAAALYERLSKMIGPWERKGTESHADIARYGLEKFRMDVPTDDGEAVEAIEAYLAGRAHAANGMGMDRHSSPFNNRNPHQVSAFDMAHPTGSDLVSKYIRGDA